MQKAIDVIVNCQSMEELLVLHWARSLSQDSPIATQAARCNSPSLTPRESGGWGPRPSPSPSQVVVGSEGISSLPYIPFDIQVISVWLLSCQLSPTLPPAHQTTTTTKWNEMRKRREKTNLEMKLSRVAEWSAEWSWCCWWWHVSSVVDSKFSWKSNNFLPKSQCVGVWICVWVCVCGVCFHLSHSSLAQATRRAAHTSNYANQAAVKGAGSLAVGGAEKREGVSVIDCCSAEIQKPHEKRIEKRI